MDPRLRGDDGFLNYKDVRYASEQEARFYFRAKLGDLKGVSVPFDINRVIKEVIINSEVQFHLEKN